MGKPGNLAQSCLKAIKHLSGRSNIVAGKRLFDKLQLAAAHMRRRQENAFALGLIHEVQVPDMTQRDRSPPLAGGLEQPPSFPRCNAGGMGNTGGMSNTGGMGNTGDTGNTEKHTGAAGAPGLTRTGTSSRTTDFESVASTNSATGAYPSLQATAPSRQFHRGAFFKPDR